MLYKIFFVLANVSAFFAPTSALLFYIDIIDGHDYVMAYIMIVIGSIMMALHTDDWFDDKDDDDFGGLAP